MGHRKCLSRVRALKAGAHATPIIDRFWFRSIYFREPSGVLAYLPGAALIAVVEGDWRTSHRFFHHNRELLAEVKRRAYSPVASGERLYTLADFYRLITLRAVDVVQMDIAHCGGLWVSKKIAAMAQAQDIRVAPHVSVGPVALAAALHFDVSTPNFYVQEAFAEYDVPWRNSLVRGWNPIHRGEYVLEDAPGLGIDIDEDAIADHPYIKQPFPSLWDNTWLDDFTQNEKS